MRVFISYGHDKHIAFARQLAKAFRDREYDVWFDEERLTGGVLWESYIEEGLEWVAKDQHGRMILIMTPHSVRRPEGFCLNELAYALDLHLPVLPIMLVWTTPPLSIYRYQWLDLTHSQGNTTFEEDFRIIVKAIESDTPYTSEENRRLERLLDPLDYSNDIALYQPGFVGREWLFKDMDSWLADSEASRVYFITGLPGVGKTAFLVKLLQTHEHVVGFHLFRRGHSEKTSVRRVISSLAYQLSRQLPDYQQYLQTIDVANELNRCNDLALFDVLISKPLFHCEPKGEPYLLLFDALDESGEGLSIPFARFFVTMVQNTPSWIRFVVSSRPVDDVLISLRQFSPRILSSDSVENMSDIEEYVKTRLYERFGDSAPDGSEIVKRSAGVFLYAKYVFDEWLPQLGFNYEEKLLPVGMGAVYYDFFSERYPDIQVYRREIRPILELMCAQVQPFTVPQMAACLGTDEDLIDDFLASCDSFFTIDSEERVRPFHSSILDWVSNKETAGRYALNPKHGTVVLSRWLFELFKQSGWDFFQDGEQSELLYTWFPAVLEQSDALCFDPGAILYSYMTQVHDKGILKDLVANRTRFHFIKSILSFMFKRINTIDVLFIDGVYNRVKEEILARAGKEGEDGFDAGDHPNFTEEFPGNQENRLLRQLQLHVDGIKYLFAYVKSGKMIVPPKRGRDYEYFVDVQIPLFYVQSSFDANSTFSTMVYGLLSAFEDGRISSMYSILSEIHELASVSFSENSLIAVHQLERVSQIMREEGWDDGMWADRVLNCAKSIRRMIEYES